MMLLTFKLPIVVICLYQLMIVTLGDPVQVTKNATRCVASEGGSSPTLKINEIENKSFQRNLA